MVIFHLDFEGKTLILTLPVPDHCLPFRFNTFIIIPCPYVVIPSLNPFLEVCRHIMCLHVELGTVLEVKTIHTLILTPSTKHLYTNNGLPFFCSKT